MVGNNSYANKKIKNTTFILNFVYKTNYWQLYKMGSIWFYLNSKIKIFQLIIYISAKKKYNL